VTTSRPYEIAVSDPLGEPQTVWSAGYRRKVPVKGGWSARHTSLEAALTYWARVVALCHTEYERYSEPKEQTIPKALAEAQAIGSALLCILDINGAIIDRIEVWQAPEAGR